MLLLLEPCLHLFVLKIKLTPDTVLTWFLTLGECQRFVGAASLPRKVAKLEILNKTATNANIKYLALVCICNNPQISLSLTLISAQDQQNVFKTKNGFIRIQIICINDYEQQISRIVCIFCEIVWKILQCNPYFYNCVLWSDETTFHNNGFINRHNQHHYPEKQSTPCYRNSSPAQMALYVQGGIIGTRVVDPLILLTAR